MKTKTVKEYFYEAMLFLDGWELDLFSTQLSRKYSYHKLIGKKRYVKLRKEKK